MEVQIDDKKLKRGVFYDEQEVDESCDIVVQKNTELPKQEDDPGSTNVVDMNARSLATKVLGQLPDSQVALCRGVTYDEEEKNEGEEKQEDMQVRLVDPNNEIVKKESKQGTQDSQVELKQGVTYGKDDVGEDEKEHVKPNSVRYVGAFEGGPTVEELIFQMQSARGKYQLSETSYDAAVIPAKRPREMYEKNNTAGLNFHLFPKGRVQKIYDTYAGEQGEMFYIIEIVVFLLNGMIREFVAEVQSDKVRHPQWLSTFSHSYAMLPESKVEKRAFRAMIQRCVENDEKPTEMLYKRNGWRQIPQLGWGFVHSQGVIGKVIDHVKTIDNEYTLNINPSTLRTKTNFENVLAVFQLCKKQSASVGLFLYTLAGLLETLFHQAGYPLKFVFGISGVTNSRKTSMALAIAQVFNRQELKADAEFSTATQGGIEKTMGKYRDGVVIIDDLKPGVNTTQRLELEKKIDKLVRFYGDRVEAKRMVAPAGSENRSNYFPVSGGCVVTMEVPPSGDSTLTRMFLVEIGKNDVNDQVLSFFQNAYTVLPTFYYSFLEWVTVEVDNVLTYMQNQMAIEREQNHFAVKRYSEMYATFAVTSQLVARYAIAHGFWNENQACKFCSNVSTIIKNELNLMGARREQRDAGKILAEAIVDAIQSDEISLISLTDDSCIMCAECYEDAEFIYVKSECLMKIFKQYSQHIGENLNITKDYAIKLLEQKELLDICITNNGRTEKSRKLPIQRGNHHRYLHIKKDVLYHMINMN